MQALSKITLNELVDSIKLTASGEELQSQPIIVWFDRLINETVDGEQIEDYLHLIIKLKKNKRIAACDSPFPIKVNDKGKYVISIPSNIIMEENDELKVRVLIMCLYAGLKDLLEALINQASFIHQRFGVATFLFLSYSWKDRINSDLGNFKQYLYQQMESKEEMNKH